MTDAPDSRTRLEAAVEALRASTGNLTTAADHLDVRAATIQSDLAAGKSVIDSVLEATGPLAVEVLRQAAEEIVDVLSRFQRAEARALYDEGLSMEEIAVLFGITRPRVSKLLRDTGLPPGGRAGRRVQGERL